MPARWSKRLWQMTDWLSGAIIDLICLSVIELFRLLFTLWVLLTPHYKTEIRTTDSGS